MAVKLTIVLCCILSAVQVQGFFGGLIGQLRLPVLGSNFMLNLPSMTLTRQNQLLFKMSKDHELAKDTFDEKLLNLTSNIQTLSQSKPIHMSCLTKFGLAKSDIQEKIIAFAVYYPKEDISVIRNDMAVLSKMIGDSSMISWTCMSKFPSMTQKEEYKKCITNHVTIQTTAELTLKIDAGIESLELKNQRFLEGITAGIDALIEKARSDFSTCISTV